MRHHTNILFFKLILCLNFLSLKIRTLHGLTVDEKKFSWSHTGCPITIATCINSIQRCQRTTHRSWLLRNPYCTIRSSRHTKRIVAHAATFQIQFLNTNFKLRVKHNVQNPISNSRFHNFEKLTAEIRKNRAHRTTCFPAQSSHSNNFNFETYLGSICYC